MTLNIIASGTPRNLTAAEFLALQDDLGLWSRIGSPRGVSEFQRSLDADAAAGLDTTSRVPLGDYNPTTVAELTTALAAATAGKVIRLVPNFFGIATAPFVVPVGVSIVSGGNTVLINGFVGNGVTSPMFLLTSGAEGTDGNQRIVGLQLRGNDPTGASTAGSGGIYVKARKNVLIQDCTATDFAQFGFCFSGLATEVDGEATTKATGNRIIGCVVINCSTWFGPTNAGYASGCIQLGSQKDFRLLNTVVIARGRDTTAANGKNGYGLKPYRNGYNDGTWVHNCLLDKDADDGTPSNFCFVAEDWNSRGFKCTNTEVRGGGWFDLNGAHSGGGYALGAEFRGCRFWRATVPTNITTMAIELECASGTGGAPCDHIVVDSCSFENARNALYIYQKAGTGTQRTRYVSFRNNRLLNTRFGEWAFAANEGGTQYFDVSHNTFRATGSFYLHSAIKIPEQGTNSGWEAHFNVIDGTRVAPMWQDTVPSGASTSVIVWTDNITWTYANNTNGSADPVFTTAPTSYTTARNRNAAPLWVDAVTAVQLVEAAYGCDENAGKPLSIELIAS